MTTSIIPIFIAALLLLSCAKENKPAGSFFGPGRQLKAEDFPNIRNSIYGAWAADTADFGSGMAYFLTLYFNDDNEVGVKRTCVGSGDEVHAAAVVDGSISASVFEIKESARVSEAGERISDCTLVVNAGSFSYKVTGDRLEVELVPGETRSFTRFRE